MSNLSEQRIMVHCDFSGTMHTAIAHGLRIANIFEKELCLFHPLEKNGKSEKLEAQKALGKIIRKLKDDFPQMPISSLTLKGKLQQNIERITEQYDGIMLVLTSENIKKKLPALQESQIPFLFVKNNVPESLQYKKVMLPVDFRKTMKETSLWASYFGRFNQSQIEILCATEKHTEYKSKTRKNKLFIEQLLYKFELDAQFTQAQKGSFALPFEALNKSKKQEFDLMIIPSSQHISLLDLIVGLPETKLIKKSGDLPILCINPKRDMYILCD